VPPTTSVGPRWVTQLPDLPGPVRDWFIGLGLLHGVPFHYLVPDPEMLSPESIQFFSVDGQWLERLCDGAFSVGRSSYKDDDLATPENEGDLTVQWQADDKSPLCGFLLRSSVITDWPDVEIIGWSQKPGSDFDDPAGPKKMVVVRKELIAPGVLLCLFEGGQMEALAFQKKAETLHFSFSREMKDGPVFKFPRKKDGTETNNDASLRLLIGGVDPDGPRKVDLAALCNGLTMGDRYGYGGAISSAELGMALLGGSEKVWFLRA
ncbi:MAG: hypothetical protein WAT19_16995, partial [Ferruginibacter sp.]